MQKILFVTRRASRCGIADYGKRVFDIIKNSKIFNFIWCEVEDENEFIINYNTHKPNLILYNYYHATLPFITNSTISKLDDISHIMIHHEGGVTFNPNCLIDIDYMLPENPEQNFYTCTRPIFENIKFEDATKNEITTIGSFGFGFKNKQLPRIAKLVCEQFDKAKIRLNIPFAMFGDNQGHSAKTEVSKIIQTINEYNKNIDLEVNHDFLEHGDLLNFLNKNDINLFLYGNEENQHGLSSSIDYALSVKKPIGVSYSPMYKHINFVSPSIVVDETPIIDIIKNGFEPLEKIYNINSNKNLLEKYEYVLTKYLK